VNEEKYAILEERVFQAYAEKTPRSGQTYDRARRCFAGGVAGDQGFWRPYPLYTTHGRGGYIYDADGNEYIDCRCSYGAALLGHGHPEVVEAVKRELDRGLLLHNLDLGVEAAELLTEVIPCADVVRYRSTGTEVVMTALSVARAFTDRDKFIKFYGAFHGLSPEVMVGWDSPTMAATSAGIPRESMANTVMLPWNDIGAVRRKLDEDIDIGTVITDVVMGVSGIFLPEGDYLKKLRELTQERGVVLIFDEVLTGFRLALGGSQEFFGVVPDLACYAKATSGGIPFAALAGRKETMSVLGGGHSRAVSQSGTMNDNTAGTAAAIASMKILRELSAKGEYGRLNSRTRGLASGIEEVCRKRGMGCHVNAAGSFFRIHFTDEEPTFDAVCGIDKRKIYLFAVALMTEGVLLCSPSSGSSFLCFAHTDDDVARILNAIDATLDKFDFAGVL